MKILFVQPDSFNPVINNAMHIYNFEPLGLYYLASIISNNHEKELFDLNNETKINQEDDIKSFKNKVIQFEPDLIIFTALTSVRTGRINELCKKVKKINAKIITVVGGIHACLMPSDFDQKFIDYLITKNPLDSFKLLINLLEKNSSINEIRNSLNLNSRAINLKDWTKPLRTIGRKYNDYYKITIGKPGGKLLSQVSSIKTSSGCPFRCNFCCLWQLYPKYEKQKTDSIIEDIKSIENEHIFLADDESMIDNNFMLSLSQRIIDERINKKFIMYARADTIVKNRKLVNNWAKAGLKQVWIGLEAANNKDLDSYNKKNTIENQEKAIKVARDYSIDVHATALVNPMFTEDDFNYLNFYIKEKLKVTSCHFFILTPFRGSKFFNEIVGNKSYEILSNNPDHYSIRQTVLRPKYMTVEKFHNLYADLIYSFNSDTIPFNYSGVFLNRESEIEYIKAKSKNEILLECIRKSHLEYGLSF